MPLIGLLAAHGAELWPLRQRLAGRRARAGVVYGRLNHCDVALQAVGQGWSRATASAARFFRAAPCAGVVITGFAGATEAGWTVGDLVMPDLVIDLRRADGGPDGRSYHPTFPVALWRAQLGWRGGTLGTVSGVVVEPAGKAEVGARLHVTAVDVETAAIAAVAARHGVPWIAARVILDPMDRPLAVVSPWHAAWLAVSVAGWGRLGQFGKDVVFAQRQLGGRLGDVVELMDQACGASPEAWRRQRGVPHDDERTA
ncbi:MAG: hypothetical protein HY600_00330 [Candidatus Omnitrophica bacterium]|nr:hypothetical protein [Candidatus Omnitrophota bacterium]